LFRLLFVEWLLLAPAGLGNYLLDLLFDIGHFLMHGSLLVLLPFADFQKLVVGLLFRWLFGWWREMLAILFELLAVDGAGVLEEYLL
jgi:hypothetical protein